MEERQCEVCGKTFFSNRTFYSSRMNNYCSEKCRGILKYHRLNKKQPTEKVCLRCGNHFLATPTHPWQVYCSGACKQAGRRLRAGDRIKILNVHLKYSKEIRQHPTYGIDLNCNQKIGNTFT